MPFINADTLIWLSLNDKVASSKKILDIFEKKTNVTIRQQNNSNHSLLYDYGSSEIITAIANFLGSSR